MELLYHYTTVDALIGMTEKLSMGNKNLTMWATDIICLNDPTEIKIGIDLINLYLEEIENELNIPTGRRIYIQKSINDSLNNVLFNEDNNIEPSYNNNIYVTSFSKIGDSLPMWSTYAKKGNGITLGFDYELMRKKFIGGNFGFSKILYDNISTELMKSFLKRIYKLAYEKINSSIYNDNLNKEDLDKLYATIMYNYFKMIVVSYIKHHSYEYEEEFRICYISKNSINFRCSNGFIIPYVEYKIPIEYLKKIIIGPTLDYERVKSPLLKLLRCKGFDLSKIEIEKSKVPFRV